MAITSDAISLLFRAKGDTDDAKKAFNDLEGTIDGTTGAVGGLSGALPIAGAALAGMAAIVVSTVVGLYNLTKASADYAGAVYDVQEKTGLSAATLSTLKVNADNAGSSLEAISGSTAKFAKLLGEASSGNEKAQKTLKDLGVTSTDLNTAFGQATKTISEAADGTDQLVLSQKAFGKSGGDLIPVIKQMGGDLEAATKEAERLGLVMTDKDLAAADNFGDALGTLSAQVKVAAVAFTSDLMPVLTRYFVMASEWYARNQSEVRVWGSTIALVLSDFGRGVERTFRFVSDHADELRVHLAAVTLGLSELLIYAGKLIAENYKARVAAQGGTSQEGAGQAIPDTFAAKSPSTGGGPKASAGKSEAQRQREEQEKKDLQAQLELQRRYLKRYEDDYKETLKRIRDEFKKTGNGDVLISAASEALEKFRAATTAAYARIDELTPAPRSDAEKALALDDRVARLKAFNAQMKQSVDENNALLADAYQKGADARLQIEQKLGDDIENVRRDVAESSITTAKDYYETEINNATGNYEEQDRLRGDATNALTVLLKAELDAKISSLNEEEAKRKEQIDKTIKDEGQKQDALSRLRDLYRNRELYATEEFEKRKKEIEDSFAIPVDGGTAAAPQGGFFGGLFGGLGTSIEDALKPVNTMQQIGQMLGQTFNQVASAVGNAVRSFVLFGSAGGSFRKFAAEVIASVAQMATVQAVFEFAQGLAMLALSWFTGNPKYGASAGAHFAAAAGFGLIAGVSAIAGRATAGNAFQKESSGAFGSAGAGGGSGGGTGNGGNVFSSQKDTVDERSINAPGGGGILSRMQSEITLKIESTTAHIVEVVRDNIHNNGPLRTAVQDATG